MKSPEYIQLCLRTEKKQYLMKESGGLSPRFDHAVMGIVTEAGELLDAVKKTKIYGKPLDITNLGEELGDIYWYLSLGCDAFEISDYDALEKFVDPEFIKKSLCFETTLIRQSSEKLGVPFDLVSLEMCAADLCYLSSKLFTYLAGVKLGRMGLAKNHALKILSAILITTRMTASVLERNVGDIWAKNIAKLAARYPDKYTDQAALNRDLKTERNILES